MTVLSVNLNKIALMRNARGEDQPDLLAAARVCVAAGCGGITVHPRPDQRHVRASDVEALKRMLPVELNVEGNPFAAPTPAGYPGLLAIAAATRPAQCTLVPDADGQLTSNHGFALERDAERLAPIVQQLKRWGCRVSLFVDVLAPGLAHAARIGADRIELYTGPYAQAHQCGDARAALAQCAATAREAQALGLGVNAGHDLNQRNLAPLLAAVPDLLEVSIGHALIGEALYDGLATTVSRYLQIIAAATRASQQSVQRSRGANEDAAG